MAEDAEPASQADDDEAADGAEKSRKRWPIVEIVVAAGTLVTAVTGLINALNGNGPT